ncbi:DUF5658 family protein [Mucisphaera calidilacus]|uniref:DUF5658 domain-containing protein n=1 Tax=Mucisphaera calidilacus TaxID=2527982 RepID=A0A518BV88_9BACT|nr:DUF5658 family protein [Mucisphaera calidilacus]QDU70871.1 hypothetical protein Pan265_07120 [Mucisphaera calidilacus]
MLLEPEQPETGGDVARKADKVRGLEVRFPDEYAWFVLVSSMDLMFTWLILNLGGSEANPLANWVYLRLGFNGLVILKFAVVILVVLICELLARLREPTARLLARAAVVISAFPSVWALSLLFRFVMG